MARTIGELPEELRGIYWANIAVIGGLGEIEAFGERLSVSLGPGELCSRAENATCGPCVRQSTKWASSRRTSELQALHTSERY